MSSPSLELLDFSKSSHSEIQALLRSYGLDLTVDEALTIQHSILKRPPSLAECLLWSIQGSEHCSYKSSRRFLKKLPSSAREVLLGPGEDAGILCLATDNTGLRYGLVLSHESHNHPSQILPFEGAATGVGGNIRDVCCMGAQVIASANALRFGDSKNPKTQQIVEGVVAGIASYSNAVGVPMLSGDIKFDPAYQDNCLVTVLSLGILREDEIIHSYAPANAKDMVFILVGKASCRSGFGGAAFASKNLEEGNDEKNCIQEPDPFLKRHLLQANYALFKKLKEKQLLSQVALKDLGAGGIACASIEMAASGGYGAEIDLDKVSLSEENLNPEVILYSETQERFLWLVPASIAQMVMEHYNDHFQLGDIAQKATATMIGRLRSDDQYIVRYNSETLGCYGDSSSPLTSRGSRMNAQQTLVQVPIFEAVSGIECDRPIIEKKNDLLEPQIEFPSDLKTVFLKLLAHENIASRQLIYERFDKQVQGRTLVEAGEGDAGILMPFNDDSYPKEIRNLGLALSLDHNPRFNLIDPYWGAVNAVVEAVRNLIASGASPVALTDCLCFGSPENPEQLWAFSESIRGIVDACQAVGSDASKLHPLPVIAGNVSFYNESEKLAIPPSPMIACIGRYESVDLRVPQHFQALGSCIFLVGERLHELGGSVFYSLLGELGANCPKPKLSEFTKEINAMLALINERLLLSAHDISEGGLAIALAEMSFKNAIGFAVTLPSVLPDAVTWFSETGGYVLEVASNSRSMVENLFASFAEPLFYLGQTVGDSLKINGVLEVSLEEARCAWQAGLANALS